MEAENKLKGMHTEGGEVAKISAEARIKIRVARCTEQGGVLRVVIWLAELIFSMELLPQGTEEQIISLNGLLEKEEEDGHRERELEGGGEMACILLGLSVLSQSCTGEKRSSLTN